MSAAEARGPVVAAYIAASRAFACCRPCTSRWLRRKGDLLLETRESEASRKVLDESMAILGDHLDDATRGHALYLRGGREDRGGASQASRPSALLP